VSYPAGIQAQYVVVNDVDGAYRIDGTYHGSAGETPSVLLW